MFTPREIGTLFLGDNTAKRALEALENAFLIKTADPIDDEYTWRIFRMPPRKFQADYLNDKTDRRYNNNTYEKITY